MKLFTTTALLLLAAFAQAKEDLPPDAKLRIGIKFRPEVCEEKSVPGDKLSMHYTGSLRTDGSVFDSSLPRNQPFDFTLGAGQVIKGWDQGEKRKLTIPSGLGYGDHGSPPKIPGKATLVFDVELLKITRNDKEL
uniref:peptidylprolyl isomerase n=1 Tax=Globisporangium ultimum (strain ATCC 200006 / CBS 805.95 / DAOM BR144) TaxID=431595 RepID=K3WIA7_GLOUD